MIEFPRGARLVRKTQRTETIFEVDGSSPERLGHVDPARVSAREELFSLVLKNSLVDLKRLRDILWNGCPANLRPICWKISLGYIPPSFHRHHETLLRKRAEYHSFSAEYFQSNMVMSSDELDILDQIKIDIPRTASLGNLLHDEMIITAIERVLFIRAIRNPAASYVQGMTDLVTPFFTVFLSETQNEESQTTANSDASLLSNVEADCYWCLCKVLDRVQDHFTYSQPGIQRVCHRVNELVSRLDRRLFSHLTEEVRSKCD